jgi:prepilin-type processing-associated H-X9-DG protein/prepilin-type N-terminal cleavage/methylation domain-containing protein
VRKPSAVSARPAFTLVELLVVLGIISVLVALLMPALVGMRKKAQAAVCGANLRSIGQALTMYTQRYGCYPSCFLLSDGSAQAIWPVRLREFTGGEQGVFYCPSQDERAEWKKVGPEPGAPGRATEVHARFGYEVGEPLLDVRTAYASYGYNGRGATAYNTSPPPSDLHKGLGDLLVAAPLPFENYCELRANRVRKPAEMIAVTDTTAEFAGVFEVFTNSSDSRTRPGKVHNGGANVLFCDGHVQWYPQKDLVVTYNQYVPAEAHIRRMWNNDHRVNYGGVYDRDDGG